MRNPTRLARLAALPLAASLLVGCGGGEDASSGEGDSSGGGSYCDQLAEAKDTFEDFGGADTDGAAVEEFFTTMHDLAGSAPDDISTEWQQVDGAITDLEDALQEAGLEVEDFAGLQQGGELPEGVEQQDLQPVITSAQEFASEENSQAFEAIEKHGRDECDVDLGGSDEEPTEEPSEG